MGYIFTKKLPERLPITLVIQKSPSACRKRRFTNVLFQVHEGGTIVSLDCDVWFHIHI